MGMPIAPALLGGAFILFTQIYLLIGIEQKPPVQGLTESVQHQIGTEAKITPNPGFRWAEENKVLQRDGI